MLLTEDQKYVKKCRLKLKLTQTEFGKLCNRHQRSVSSWEKGTRNPDKLVMDCIIQYMKNHDREKKT